MQIESYPSKSTTELLRRSPGTDLRDSQRSVEAIVTTVRREGDAALKRYTSAFDGVDLDSLVRPLPTPKRAAEMIDPELKRAIDRARDNIEQFHRAQETEMSAVEIVPGVRCWRRQVPVESVGLYVPGGHAPLLSTALMLLVPAMVAGCRERVLCTPPQANGSIPAGIQYIAASCGVTSLFTVGGAQAVAAMAYGTESVPRVDKIFGPGNSYVTAAKQLVAADGVAIDLPAGPSEVLVIADASAPTAYVTAELLAQAEHGPDSQVVLVTDSRELAQTVLADLQHITGAHATEPRLLAGLSRARVILVDRIETALQFSNGFAPEHLVLMVQDAATLAEGVTAAGSVFVGTYSPVAAGDYATGTNHTLPTSGAASAWSGLSVDSFFKTIEFQELSQAGLQSLAPTIDALASAEGLQAHAESVRVRLPIGKIAQGAS